MVQCRNASVAFVVDLYWTKLMESQRMLEVCSVGNVIGHSNANVQLTVLNTFVALMWRPDQLS